MIILSFYFELFCTSQPPSALRLHPTLTHFNVKTTLAECCREDFSHCYSFFFFFAPRLAFLTIDLISQTFLQLVTLVRESRCRCCCFKLAETEARMEMSRLSHRSPSVMYDIHSHNVSVWKRIVGLSHVQGNLAACRLHSAGSLTEPERMLHIQQSMGGGREGGGAGVNYSTLWQAVVPPCEALLHM